MLIAIAARIWRKRSRRLYSALVGRCWPSKHHRLQEPKAGGDTMSGDTMSGESLAGGRVGSAGLTARAGKTLVNPSFAAAGTPDDEPIFGGGDKKAGYSDSAAAADQ